MVFKNNYRLQNARLHKKSVINEIKCGFGGSSQVGGS